MHIYSLNVRLFVSILRPSHQRSKLRQRAAKSRILFIIILCLKTVLCSIYTRRAENKEHAAIFYLSDLLFIFAPIITERKKPERSF
nr:MAG TPA: hypothetical protein [Caudoviricetes sp.]